MTGVNPVVGEGGKVGGWEVCSINKDGRKEVRCARNVVVAVGGKPNIPKKFPKGDERIIHSSAYAYAAPKVLNDTNAKYNIAVIGGGQSAAEIFQDLNSRYLNARTRLVIKNHALRPSDDSPL